MLGEADTKRARELLLGIRGLVRRFSVAERADVACCGVTVAQAATLETLRREGPLRLSALGRRLGVAPSTLSRNVERLEGSGLVQRESDAEDARSWRISLTEKGRSAARELERQELDFARQILDRLPEERREDLSRAFQDLLVAVREATEACCPGAYEHLMDGLPGQRPTSGRLPLARDTGRPSRSVPGRGEAGGAGCGCGPGSCGPPGVGANGSRESGADEKGEDHHGTSS